MSNIEFTFENPLLLLLILPALAVILIPFLRLPKNRRKSKKKIIPVILHALIAVILVLILSGFTLVHYTAEQAVMLLLDFSHSTEPVQAEISAHAEELLELMDENTPVGVIVFGKEQVYSLRAEGKDRTLSLSEVNASATHIEDAIEYAVSLLPSDKADRLILLSDGKETDGDAERIARYMATKNIRIDAVYFDTTDFSSPEMQISRFSCPTGAFETDEILLTAEIKSNTAGEATLILYDNETLLSTQSVVISQGSTVVELTAVAEGAGQHTFRLELEADADTLTENNVAYAPLSVDDKINLLILSDTAANGAALQALLPEKYVVTVIEARNAPVSIVELCDYDEIILSNVNLTVLPAGYDVLLERYVSEFGRSLLAAGGIGTFMFGEMKDTAIEKMLPVDLYLNDTAEGDSVALMLVLDTSSSMSVGSQSTTYLLMAKQGAIRCVDSLTDNDFAGVISFNSDAYLKSTLIEASEENKASITRTISALTTSGGTYYTDALKMAHEELLASDAKVKHVLFLSDGQPNDHDYLKVVRAMAEDNITVSTISLGYASGPLLSMADTSGGRYYEVRNAYSLPSIMLSETRQVATDTFITGEFIPVIKKESELTEALSTTVLPTLTGYLGTTLKEGATAYLTFENGHPLYASWQYGKGKVSCFTSDLNGGWSSAWFSSETGKELILSMVDTTVSDTPSNSTLSLDMDVRGGTVDITVTTSGESKHTLRLTSTYGEETKSYMLSQVETGVFQTSIQAEQGGIYSLTIKESDSRGDPVDELQTAIAVSYSSEYDVFAPGGKALLSSLCYYTGGALWEDMRSLAEVEIPPIGLSLDPTAALAFLACVLLLIDIAVRRIRWRDVRNQLKTIAERLHR